jgi:NADP-dependent 3-hydroxy acid dehydrogenase YdfG
MNDAVNALYFIAGGTGGIGSEVARCLRAQGANVALAARNESRLEERARELGARAVPMDATRPEAVTGAFDAVLDEGRRLLGVVNCIGTILLKPAHLTGQVLHVDGGLSTVQAR